jgi:hypothetical protein
MSLFTDIEYLTATIASGTSLSGAVNFGAKTLVGIVMPSSWTAPDLAFQVSPDGGTTLTRCSSPILPPPMRFRPSRCIRRPLRNSSSATRPNGRGINIVKVRSGTSGTLVNQGSTAAITLVVRGNHLIPLWSSAHAVTFALIS